MTGLEILLIIIGLIIVGCSYIFSEHMQAKNSNTTFDDSNINISAISEQKIREQIDDTVINLIEDTIEKTESMLDKVTNEKIIAVSEYSDKVLEEINKTHSEVMFLYNMLNDKESDIKNTIKEINSIKNNLKENIIIKENEIDKIINESEKEIAVTIVEEDNQQLNSNSMIWDLYNQGKSIMEIAKQLGLGIGEVRLVIDLYNSNLNKNQGFKEAL